MARRDVRREPGKSDAQPPRKKNRWLRRVLVWGVALALLVVLALGVAVAMAARSMPGFSELKETAAGQTIVVRARDARRPEFGTIVLAFQRAPGAPGGLRLEGWTAIDAQNKRTTVRLSNQRYNVAVPDSAFNFAEPKRKKA